MKFESLDKQIQTNKPTVIKTRAKFLLPLLVLLTLQIAFGVPQLAISESPEADFQFGFRDIIHVFPGKVITNDWVGAREASAPDLAEDDLYQKFAPYNSAHVPLPGEVVPSARGKTAPVITDPVTLSNEEDVATSSEVLTDPELDLNTPESDVESVENPQPAEPVSVPAPAAEPEPEPVEVEAPAEETTVYKRATESLLTFFSSATGLFPFVNSNTTTPSSLETTPILETEPALEASLTESSAPESEAEVREETDPVLSESVATPVVVNATGTNTTSQTPATETATSSLPEQSTEEDSVIEIISDNEQATTTATSSEDTLPTIGTDTGFAKYKITLSDFSIPKLKPGEYITGVQLRASLGAKYNRDPEEAIPSFSLVYSSSSTTREVGSVYIDDEVSNAYNGGYYLFALPEITDVKTFNDIAIDVIFNGNVKNLEGAYLDAVWLEINTERITKDDLIKRTEFEIKQHLKQPGVNQFVSDKFDFTRFENPTFNLRYVSQRSKPVEAIRQFLGQSKVRIDKVNVLHKGSGLVGVKPDVTVTAAGLITVSIPDKERAKLKPGVYTVELLIDEGGYELTDSFEFQWGLLAINPDKAASAVGETLDISMGALTPNGNTLCNANLRLYVVDPTGLITEPTVSTSGQCDGNNVIDVPDYSANYVSSISGVHELYLERLDTNGSVISHTYDTFLVNDTQPLKITRLGPTRIYPPSPYDMGVTVSSETAFTGTLIERVPSTFEVFNTNAKVQDLGTHKELIWDVNLSANDQTTFSYSFDAPDLSPFLYELGPATVSQKGNNKPAPVNPAVASSTITSSSTQGVATTTNANSNNNVNSYQEHRQWQIASDATGNMILYYTGTGAIPTDWSCLSCGSGTFFQTFAVGSSTYSGSATLGNSTHTHTASGSVLATTNSTVESFSGTGVSAVTHTHTLAPTIGATSSLPAYTQLRVIQYTASAGEPATIPAGAVGIFDVASSSLPVGWNRYAPLDDRYPYAADTVGTQAGSNVHTHSVTGTTGASGGTQYGSRNNQISATLSTHTHTMSSTTPRISNEPPYLNVLFAELSADAAPPTNLITMWTEDVPSGWSDVSSDPASDFNNRFIKGATSYGSTGGAATHAHSDMTGIVTSGPSGAGANARIGSGASDNTHTHNASVTSFSTTNSLPPYTSAVFGKRLGTDPVYDQISYRWYVNNNAQTPTDPWPSGGTDLSEKGAISATSTPVKDGDIVRLRINAEVTNATSTAGQSFKLQYGAADDCTVAAWTDVGNTASSTVWRGYNASPADHSTITTNRLASSTVSETYEENGYATSTPNEIAPDQVGEWDFVLEHNGAIDGTNYCFRMVESDGTAFSSYSSYPQLLTNYSPTAPTLSKLFDNEKTASTSLKFQFVSTDPEAESIHYQVQIDDNYAFTSTLEDRDSISNSSQFENQVLPSDKAPFNSGELMEFTAASTFVNGTTYYWRVRGQDPAGSGDWGDWSTIYSFTIDTTLVASGWFQTTEEQFESDTLSGVGVAGSNQVTLISGSTTGSITSSAIVFGNGDSGTAWDSLTFNDTETVGDIKYQIEYYDGDTWTLVPDTDLSGNSTGFDTSPVSLLTVDTDTYGTLRIVGNFTNTGGSPSLQDWTINWGYRVETPTITKLFPNEKTSTTTPTFEFSTTDPQNDSLTYQISWSTDKTFTSSTTRTSDVSVGFINIDDGVDTDPFNSGETIQFTIQSADALSNNATYWWRVRAKDTTGDDAYSFWTTEQSFTVDTTVLASTWFQTTEEQFGTNILSGTIPLSNDTVSVATTASEAMMVYGQGTEIIPRYRQWDGSAWGSEGTLQSVGAPLRWVKVKAGTQREEYVAATLGTDADINVQVFANGVWGDLQEVTTAVSNFNARGFDVAYETLSGDAMVVYCDGDALPSYRIWNGSTWSTETGITVSETTNCDWIQLASDPVSDEIIMLMRGSDGSPYEAQVWSGSVWGNATTLGSIAESAHEGMAVAYEASGGQALIVTSDGNPARFRYNSWNGSAWAGAATVGIDDDFEWGTLVADVGSDELALCYQDEDTNIGLMRWSGSAWNTFAASDEVLNTTGKAKTDPGFSCVFENSGSRDNYIMVAYTDTTQTNYSFWNNSTVSTGVQINSMTDTITSELQRTGDDTILGLFFDETNDSLLSSNWNGSTWSTVSTIESDASVGTSPYGRPYNMAPRNDSREGTTIVSPGIDFDDGNGPYWQEFSWTDTTPGTSDILYSLQYWDGDSWEFIPDSAIAGNSTGSSTGPIDLTGLNKNTYNEIRPYAALSCDGSGNCPQLQDWTVTWAEGITVSGTLQQYDQSSSVGAGTIAVAVNGVIQIGKTAAVSAGSWSISNVTVFPGDIVTVFVSGANDSNEAVAVTRYDGVGDIEGIELFERHVSLGSNDATSTPLTNTDVAIYNSAQDEDVFFNLSGSTLDLCADVGCNDVELFINSSTTFTPGGNVLTHDLENNGRFTLANTLYIDGSWDNNATTTMTGSTVVFSATSSSESIDSTGAFTSSFNNVTLGTTTGNASWTPSSTLDVNGVLTVSRGTLTRGTTSITVAGNLITSANGFWTGVGTTTFDGATAASWLDQNATKQNIGNVVIDGTNKVVSLGSNVAAQSITIGSNDTLDASITGYDITVYSNWTNNNTFLPRTGEVLFAATTTGRLIDVGGAAFYDLSFTGVGGDWSFVESTLSVNNNFTIATGTVTMPTATTTLAGSFNNSGGTFGHNNAAIVFTSIGAETITANGTNFNNGFYNLSFTGGGSWSFADTNATSSNNVFISGGTVTFPTGTLAVGGSLLDTGGAFSGNGGTVQFDTAGSASVQAGGSSFSNFTMAGSGSLTFLDTNATIAGDVYVASGTLILPSGTLSVGGSWDTNATVNANSGNVNFDSSDTGETVDFGNSDMYNVSFDSASGGWTLLTNATTTNNFSLLDANSFSLAAAQTLAIAGNFTNSVGGASTTWSGSTLRLTGGDYSVNTKSDNGDVYETVEVGGSTDIDWWNSEATTYLVSTGGSLYSQDHAGVDGDLYVWGDYTRTGGNEYWSYATDFDGTDLTGGSERQVDVRLASGTSIGLSSTTFQVLGVPTASTTVANQGSGTYTVSASAGTTSAQYYQFADLGGAGLSLLDSVSVPLLRDGRYIVGGASGSALTLSSTTIDANPGKQIYNVYFATTTAIAANNVTQTDGTPTSYWWFRNGSGNLYGESHDNDTGDPGSVRFDDSSLVITIEGTIYTDDGGTPLVGSTCDDGVTTPVRVVVSGGSTYDGTCASADGTFSIGGVVVVGDPVLTIYLNDATGGEKAVTVTKTPTTDLTDLDLYVNRVITRHEDTEALTIADLAKFDNSNDIDIQFSAATGTADTLTVFSNNELHVWATTTFTPGGSVTLLANATANAYDGSLHIGEDAIFTGTGTTTYTVGGSVTLESGATFVPASTTVLMTATTTGKTISTVGGQDFTVHDLSFVGSGGAWNLNGDLLATGNIDIDAGTVTGTGDITLNNGSLSGNGLLSLGGGTVTLAKSNTLGGSQGWTFNNLTLGNGSSVGTTTPASAATTTVEGVLTIANAHFLDAGSSAWSLTGTGNVFVETGTFLEDTSTVQYGGTAAMNVLSTNYYNLLLNAPGGSPTYTATGLGIQVFGDMTVGGTDITTVNFTTNDPALNIDGDLTILSNGTLIASNSASFTLAGNYDNNGVLTASGGTLTLDGTGSVAIAAGNSVFATVDITGTGSFTFTEHATATAAFTIGNALTSFTLNNGQTLAVGGTFSNQLGGAATTWTGSNLYLYGGGNYLINTKSISDTYENLDIAASTHIRSWNSSASNVATASGGSLYSMDHVGSNGELYIYGDYTKTSGTDHWSYATDFDGTSLSGSERLAQVFIAGGDSVTYAGTAGLLTLGSAGASTTIANQGSGVYSFTIGGGASTTLDYYAFQDFDSDGLTFTGTPNVVNISHGSFLVANNADSAITVGGTAINTNPAKTFTNNYFATSSGVTTAVNVTATGTSVSSWRFTNHAGDIDGETFDSDPDGDPGYIVWDDSAASITISGVVYSDEGSAVSTVCDSSTANITLVVAGLTATSTNCNGDGLGGGTGQYSFSGITYSPGDSLIVYINGETEKAATVTEDPVSSIANMDLYEYRVIVRHEGIDSLSIDDMAVYDSSDDPDIPFTALSGSPDTLTLPADRKLIVWNNKTFAPGGNVTLTNGGSQSYGGSFELYSGANFTAVGTQVHNIGGSLISQAGSTYTAGNSTTTFTTSGAGRTIDINDGSFYNLAFTGSGDWTVSDTILDAQNLFITNGTITLPTGTSTISGSFVNNGGTFSHSGGSFDFDGSGSGNQVAFGGSNAPALYFTGSGSWTMTDTNATSTNNVTVSSGTLTLPSGSFTVEGSFLNNSGTITHNTSELIISTSTVATVRASSSDLYGVTFRGAGSYRFADLSLTLLDDLILESGSLNLATGTLSVGGSFLNTGGSFAHNGTGTVLFNSTDTGETIDPGGSDFYNMVFGSASGGWTIIENATATRNFTLSTATNFTQQTGTTLYVGNVFKNYVGGSATTWTGSTLLLGAGAQYELNTKTTGGDDYQNLVINGASDVSMWNSKATSTTVASDSSLYSKDHGANDGALYIYGDYHIGTTTEYWSYATDFDSTSLAGSERAVTVSIASGATTTLDGGILNIVGSSGNETTITNQGSGQYSFNVSAGTINAQYYDFRNLDSNGLNLSGIPVVSSLSYGDFELAVNGGNLISLSSTTLNANASLVVVGNRFATTTAITGTNINLAGTTGAAWTFTGHAGNLDGEDFDVDGATACGSVRWDDSACLLVQQTEYRWRNDNGGLGVPDSEWYDVSWGKRQSVSIDNADNTTYTDAVVEVIVPYDANMQADFDDLRFTDSSGTTTTPHFIASTTNGIAAEVWVKVPSLPAQGTARLYMYYDNAVATTTSSSTLTFIAADDFEDGGITEYTGANDDKALFNVGGSFAYGGSFGLDNTGNTAGQADDGGMARFDQTISQGQTIRYMEKIDTTNSEDEVCTMFGVQSPVSNNQNYAVCLEQIAGTDYISITKDIVDSNENSGTQLAATDVVYSNGWYEVEIDWGTDNSITASLYDDYESLVAVATATDSTYTSGGYGFTYWYNKGGWDNFTVRPTLVTEPEVRFGAEVSDGGASWAAAQNTSKSYTAGDVARLRLGIENSGLAITNQNFQLEFASKGVAPSCEAVSGASYAAVPTQASCGTSALCMIATANYANGAATADLLSGTEGLFTPGEAIENPASITGSLDIDQNEFTELEYAITPTVNAVDTAYCLRVTDSGSELDTYLRVAELQLRFDPVVGTVSFNNGGNISLVGGTTTRVYATSSVSDANGYADMVLATSTMYTNVSGANCTADNNDCYITTTDSQCSFTNCSGNSCVLSCYADFLYHADPTDETGGDWYALLEVEDSIGGSDFDTSIPNDVITLNALTVANAIGYGSLEAATNTGAVNATTSIQNIGNNAIDINLDGTDLTDGVSSVIPVTTQKFATTSFDYNACVNCTNLSTTTISQYEVDLSKPTDTTPPVEDVIYWGIAVPFGTASNPHTGFNTFYAVSDSP